MFVPVSVLLSFALLPSVPSPLGKGLRILQFLAQGNKLAVRIYVLSFIFVLVLMCCSFYFIVSWMPSTL